MFVLNIIRLKILFRLACFSFNDRTEAPVVVTTTTKATASDGHILVERILEINHVNTSNPSSNVSVSPINMKKERLSARPFDEFPCGTTVNDDSANNGNDNK